jgi:hypothetical protein
MGLAHCSWQILGSKGVICLLLLNHALARCIFACMRLDRACAPLLVLGHDGMTWLWMARSDVTTGLWISLRLVSRRKKLGSVPSVPRIFPHSCPHFCSAGPPSRKERGKGGATQNWEFPAKGWASPHGFGSACAPLLAPGHDGMFWLWMARSDVTVGCGFL